MAFVAPASLMLDDVVAATRASSATYCFFRPSPPVHPCRLASRDMLTTKHGERAVPEYPIFSPISSQEGTRVAINPERVSSLVETGPKRVTINLPDGGAVSVAMSLEQVTTRLRGDQLAEE